MAPRGLVLLVGSTGSGKSTTLASMIDYRNSNTSGHILTIEDPIEYLHKHKQSIVNQREVGIDTHAFHNALKNAMREAPDVILIGEILERETMEAAIAFAETGHICLATLHSNNADQTIERILNFFPEGAHKNVLMNLALNLKAVVSQRLVVGVDGRRMPAAEVLINTPMIRDLLRRGQVHEIKQAMEESLEAGMETFDQCLFRLYKEGKIEREEALRAADSRDGLALKFRLSEGGSGEHDPYADVFEQACASADSARPARLTPVRRVGLAFRPRGIERRQRQAGLLRSRTIVGIRRQVDRSGARCRSAGSGSSPRSSAHVAVAEGAGRRMVLQQRFERSEAFDDPVPHPYVALGLRHAPVALEVLQHAQVVERVDVAGDQLRQRAHALAIARGSRQQRRIGPHFVEVFEDRQRLPQHAVAMLQHRHQLCGLAARYARCAARRRRAAGARARSRRPAL